MTVAAPCLAELGADGSGKTGRNETVASEVKFGPCRLARQGKEFGG
jgi:hypothetical protein